MAAYMDASKTAAYLYGDDPEKIIRLMADRFQANHPAEPFVWRTWDERGIQADRAAGYHMNFGERFPDSRAGQIAFAAAELYCAAAKNSNFTVQCHGPVKIFLNGELVFTSAGQQEREHTPCRFPVSLKQGFNRFLIRCECTAIGFGCVLANAMPQWEPCCYVLPFDQRGGEAGWLYTAPGWQEPDMQGGWGADEVATGLDWLPENETELRHDTGEYWGWAAFELAESRSVCWQGGAAALWVDGNPASDEILSAGRHELLMRGTLPALRSVDGGVELTPPVSVKGRCSRHLVLKADTDETPAQLMRLEKLHGGHVWQTDLEGIALRPFAEAELFGRWTYPLGVTLYGMLMASRLLEDGAMERYVRAHVDQVTGIHQRAEWETARWGFSGVNQQLCWLDALDDCGSFGSLMLTCDPEGTDPDKRAIASEIGAYMLDEQPRTREGAFCRRDDTIWADDMYMSVPFLCRYAAMSGDSRAMDECARQLLCYRELLLMKDKGIMSHMRCMRHDKPNGVPWSRGNGWVLFSLSELLMRLDAEHPLRARLMDFFLTLTEGYLRLQDENGMWHQILDEKETYPEASATAMFICAFARGARLGWFSEELARRASFSAERAWDGLCNTVISRDGDLYGVCQGSGFSFSRAYYRTLGWRFNDAHGIGIVMLAGTEILLMENKR